MRPSSFARGAIIGVGLFVVGTVRLSAQHPIQFGTAQSPASVTLGVLAQGSLQVDSTPQADAATDFCLRRLRFIAGGKVARKLRFFADSDTSYLGLHGTSGWTSQPTILQDAFVTYEIRPALQIDAGLMLVPLSYNGAQSAASLLPITATLRWWRSSVSVRKRPTPSVALIRRRCSAVTPTKSASFISWPL